MATFKFYQEYTETIIVREHFEIEADSYEEALKMIEENDGYDLAEIGELMETERIKEDWWEHDCTKPNLTYFSADGEEI